MAERSKYIECVSYCRRFAKPPDEWGKSDFGGIYTHKHDGTSYYEKYYSEPLTADFKLPEGVRGHVFKEYTTKREEKVICNKNKYKKMICFTEKSRLPSKDIVDPEFMFYLRDREIPYTDDFNFPSGVTEYHVYYQIEGHKRCC